MENLSVWIWLIGGLLLMVSELFLPGIVAVFLGAAAVLVAGLQAVGVIEGLMTSILVWMGLSVGLTVSLRRTVAKYLPAEVTKKNLSQGEADALGVEVEVLETVYEDNTEGRIRYQGTTWPATSTRGTIDKGAAATLVARDNLAWLVEPARLAKPERHGALVPKKDD